MAVGTDVTALARSILDDAGTGPFTDAVLLPMLTGAYRDLQRILAVRGSTLLVDTATANITAVSGVTMSAPTGLIVPYEMYEKETGGTGQYVPMERVDTLPDRSQSGTMGEWAYMGGELRFVGSTGSRSVKLKYAKALTAITAVGDTLLIPDSVDALAWMVAKTAATSRGDFNLAQSAKAEADERIAEMIGVHTHSNQRVMRRRLGYSR